MPLWPFVAATDEPRRWGDFVAHEPALAPPGSVDEERARTIGLLNELNGDFLADEEQEAAMLLTLGLLAPKLRFSCEANEGGGAARTESPGCSGDRIASISGDDAADADFGSAPDAEADAKAEPNEAGGSDAPAGRGDV